MSEQNLVPRDLIGRALILTDTFPKPDLRTNQEYAHPGSADWMRDARRLLAEIVERSEKPDGVTLDAQVEQVRKQREECEAERIENMERGRPRNEDFAAGSVEALDWVLALLSGEQP